MLNYFICHPGEVTNPDGSEEMVELIIIISSPHHHDTLPHPPQPGPLLISYCERPPQNLLMIDFLLK